MTTNLVLDARQRAMLAEMGVRVWLPSNTTSTVTLEQPKPQVKPDEALQPIANAVPVPVRREPPLRLPVLAAPPVAIGSAPVRYVVGNLPENSNIEGGDFDIILLGEPCTGEAEKLLANMVRVLGKKIFTAQMVPSHNEAESLLDQLALMPSKVVVALGPHAAKALLGEASGAMPFGKLRGAAHPVDSLNRTAIVTYHPLQLLRQPLAKAQAWLDLKLVMKETK
jgi:uracil-DNA glycosylase family 4